MSRYAEKTSVSAQKSKAEIERTLSRYGADEFAYGTAQGRATIGFKFKDSFVRFDLVLPSKTDPRFTRTETGRARKAPAAEKAWEQGCRSAWRSLSLVIKAKLEAVEAGITTFEREFMANLMLPNGKTAGDVLLPQIEEAANTGRMPKLLPYGGK